MVCVMSPLFFYLALRVFCVAPPLVFFTSHSFDTYRLFIRYLSPCGLIPIVLRFDSYRIAIRRFSQSCFPLASWKLIFENSLIAKYRLL